MNKLIKVHLVFILTILSLIGCSQSVEVDDNLLTKIINNKFQDSKMLEVKNVKILDISDESDRPLKVYASFDTWIHDEAFLDVNNKLTELADFLPLISKIPHLKGGFFEKNQGWINLEQGKKGIYLSNQELLGEEKASSHIQSLISNTLNIIKEEKLNQKNNLDSLYVKNLRISQDPFIKNNLLITGIVTNEWHLDQPFPIIEMLWSNTENVVIATTTSTAREYLRAFQSGSLIGTKSSFDINLSIPDPSPEVVNYKLSFKEY